MNKLFYLTLLIIIFSCKKNNLNEASITIDISSEIVVPKEYIVIKNNQDIIIDGKANEASWQSAIFTDSFIDIEASKTPKFDTKLKILWDEKYLYIYVKMEEPHIWGNLKQRDTIIFYNNDFEVFISPSGTTKNYGEIEINALGTVWDLLLNRPYKEFGHPNNFWNLTGLKTAIHIEGTLNNPNDIDSYWSVEMAIPMEEIVLLKNLDTKTPIEGEQWRINFSRVQWGFDLVDGVYQRKKDRNGKYFPENNWVWSQQGVIDMHEPEKWGTIHFTNSTVTEKNTFKQSEQTRINIAAIAVYRKTINGELKYLRSKKAGTQRNFNIIVSENEYLEAIFYKTHSGFEYTITSPKTERVYIINESGVLKQKK